MSELGLLLLGSGASVARQAEAVDWLRKAAAQDDARAVAQLAVLAGAGDCMPQDWTAALDGLQRAAELGSAPAQAELALLAAGPLADVVTIPPHAGMRWHELRAAVDVSAWTTAPPRPCLLRARMASASDLPRQVMELTKVLRYAVGEHFKPHFDFIDPTQPGPRHEIEARGQRLATLLIYLNDDHAGGESEFPLLGLRHRGRRGDALLFANVDQGSLPEQRSLHAGLPACHRHAVRNGCCHSGSATAYLPWRPKVRGRMRTDRARDAGS
ncbi:MAG: 2OG-Fe(II) oxygenase [Pseudomonadota bacterium]|nr:2OG-Fe(II) oxygenase [Pseudomonadota bacterium]